MSLPLILLDEAKAEFDDSHDWYENQQAGLGARFNAAIRGVVTLIRKNPLRFPVVYKDVRKATVPVFPFRIFYAVGEDCILVTCVFHTSRDPAVWQGRR